MCGVWGEGDGRSSSVDMVPGVKTREMVKDSTWGRGYLAPIKVGPPTAGAAPQVGPRPTWRPIRVMEEAATCG